MNISVVTHNQEIISAPQTQVHRSWWQYLGQVLIFAVLALAFLEGLFRLAGVGGGQFLKPDLQLGTRHIPGKQVIWRVEGFSNNKISSAGLRDSEHTINKQPGTYRIALLGDSLVEALQVDLNDTFGKKLETSLNDIDKNKHYETINFGCGGYSTGQEFLQYQQQGAKYKPDAIVLLYNRGDSMESVVKQKDRKHVEPRPYFYIDQSGQLQEDDSVLTANYDKLKPNLVLDWLRKSSTVYGAICQTDFSLSLNEPLYRRMKGWWTSLVSRALFLTRAHLRAPLHGAVSTYPDQDEMVVTKALIKKLANQATQNGQGFILVIYPNLDHFAALTEQTKELKLLADKNHFSYLDLSPPFLADPQPRSNFELYHFNKKGHITVAKALFEVMRKQLELK